MMVPAKDVKVGDIIRIELRGKSERFQVMGTRESTLAFYQLLWVKPLYPNATQELYPYHKLPNSLIEVE